jgi:hypothetical protein
MKWKNKITLIIIILTNWYIYIFKSIVVLRPRIWILKGPTKGLEKLCTYVWMNEGLDVPQLVHYAKLPSQCMHLVYQTLT